MKLELQALSLSPLFTTSWEGPQPVSDSHILFSSHFILNRLNITACKPSKACTALASEHLLEGSLLYFSLPEKNIMSS